MWEGEGEEASTLPHFLGANFLLKVPVTMLTDLLPNQAVEDSAWAIAKTVETLVVSKWP